MGFDIIIEKIKVLLDLLEKDHATSMSFLLMQLEHQEKLLGAKAEGDFIPTAVGTCEIKAGASDVRASSACAAERRDELRECRLRQGQLVEEALRSFGEAEASGRGDGDSSHKATDQTQTGARQDSNHLDSNSTPVSLLSRQKDTPHSDGPEHDRSNTNVSDSSWPLESVLLSGSQKTIQTGISEKTAAFVMSRSSIEVGPKDVFEIKEDWRKVPVASDIYLDQVDAMLAERAARSMMYAGHSLSMQGSILMKPLKIAVPEHLIMHPSSAQRMVWDLTGVALISWDMVMIPIQLAFDPDEVLFTTMMGWITLGFWTLDMFASVMTGFYRNGILVMNHREIITNYLKGWFIVDIIVVVPDWVMKLLLGSGESAMGLGRIVRTARIFRVLRLLRLLKLKRLFESIYDMLDSEISFILFNLWRLLVLIIFMNHLVACTWYWIGRTTRNNGAPKNWLEHVGLTPVYGESLAWRYLTALHWSITQFTPASMDISATNVGERLFSVCILFWALVMLSSIIGSITASMTALRNISADESKQFWILRRYLKQHKIPRDLTNRIIRYVEHQHITKHNVLPRSKVSLLTELSDQLQIEMVHAMCSTWFMDHPFFSYMRDDPTMKSSMQKICYDAVKATPCAEEEVLFSVGDEGRTMFFVKSGEYSYSLPDGTYLPTMIGPKLWAAEAVLWTSWRHRGTLRAAMPSEVLGVNPEKFSAVLHLHPKPWYFAMNYAVDFVNFMNRQDPTAISDVMFDMEVWTSVVQESDTYVVARRQREDLQIMCSRTSQKSCGEASVEIHDHQFSIGACSGGMCEPDTAPTAPDLIDAGGNPIAHI